MDFNFWLIVFLELNVTAKLISKLTEYSKSECVGFLSFLRSKGKFFKFDFALNVLAVALGAVAIAISL